MVDLDRWAARHLDAATVDTDHAQARPIRDADARRRLMARRSVTRRLLADYLGADPTDIAIERTCPTCHAADHGRPSVTNAAIEFSVSSSRGIAAVAISNRSVGVDVEVVRSDMTPLIFALSDQERQGVLDLVPDQQGMAFLRLWTAKEAALKAADRCLDGDLSVVDVQGLLADDRTMTVVHDRAWQVRQMSIDHRVDVPVLVALADSCGAEVNLTYLEVTSPTAQSSATD